MTSNADLIRKYEHVYLAAVFVSILIGTIVPEDVIAQLVQDFNEDCVSKLNHVLSQHNAQAFGKMGEDEQNAILVDAILVDVYDCLCNIVGECVPFNWR